MAGPRPFPSADLLRAWFAKHARTKSELWVVFYKKHTGRRTVTYPQALEEALCFGWIDGKVKRLDDDRYMQGFTPRRADSVWSSVNIRKAETLIATGRMTPDGLAAFERRDRSEAQRRTYDHRPKDLPEAALAQMRKDPRAWDFWQSQPLGFRRMATWYVLSAQREETRARRLATLIEHAARGERPPTL